MGDYRKENMVLWSNKEKGCTEEHPDDKRDPWEKHLRQNERNEAGLSKMVA